MQRFVPVSASEHQMDINCIEECPKVGGYKEILNPCLLMRDVTKGIIQLCLLLFIQPQQNNIKNYNTRQNEELQNQNRNNKAKHNYRPRPKTD